MIFSALVVNGHDEDFNNVMSFHTRFKLDIKCVKIS